MLPNIYKSKHPYVSIEQKAQLQLCDIRVPEPYLRGETFTRTSLSVCPIEIGWLTIICVCTKKYQYLVRSKGVSCPECSHPLEIHIS